MLEEQERLYPKFFTKKPKTYILLGLFFIVLTYIISVAYPPSLLIFLPMSPTWILTLSIFSIGLFFLYFNLNYKVQGYIQICFGVITLEAILIIFLEGPSGSGFVIALIIWITPTILSIFCGIFTMRNVKNFNKYGFFSVLNLTIWFNSSLVMEIFRIFIWEIHLYR